MTKIVLEKQARIITKGTGEWSQSILAMPGDLIEVTIRCSNHGHKAASVLVVDNLPDCLEYISGQAPLFNLYGPRYTPHPEDIFISGVLFPRIQPQEILSIVYRAKVMHYPAQRGPLSYTTRARANDVTPSNPVIIQIVQNAAFSFDFFSSFRQKISSLLG